MPRASKTTIQLLEDEIRHQQARIRFLEGRYELTGSRTTYRTMSKHMLILWSLEKAVVYVKEEQAKVQKRR